MDNDYLPPSPAHKAKLREGFKMLISILIAVIQAIYLEHVLVSAATDNTHTNTHIYTVHTKTKLEL